LKSIYFSPKNDLPYKEIASSILPRGLRTNSKRISKRDAHFKKIAGKMKYCTGSFDNGMKEVMNLVNNDKY